VAAKCFLQNPRWWPFKIKKDTQNPNTRAALSIDTIFDPPQFPLDNTFKHEKFSAVSQHNGIVDITR
jgi:hypothetical protein